MAIRQAITPQHNAGTALERKEQTLRPLVMYRVLLLNDDCTSMELVVMILQQYFSKDWGTVTQIMLTVHQGGKDVCGLYTQDITATKVELVSTHTRQAGHSLQCTMEGA